MYKKVALRYLMKKEAGLFDAPPVLLEDVTSFMEKKYAGHILARTEKRISHLQGKDQVDYRKIYRDLKQTYDDINNFMDEYLYDDVGRSEEKTFPFRPDEGKQISIRVEDSDYFYYSYIRDRRKGKEYGKYKSYKMKDKIYKLFNKTMSKVHDKALKQERMEGSPESDLVELTLLKKECLKFTNKAKEYKTKSKTDVSVDLNNWDVLERSMDDAKKKVQSSLSALRDQKVSLAERIESLDEGSFDFEIIHYSGWGVAIEEQVIPLTVHLEDGNYILEAHNYVDQALKGMFVEEEDLISHVEKVIDDTIGFMVDTLDDITWSNIHEALEYDELDEITIVLDFKGHSRRGGQWHPSKKQLEVDMPKDSLTVDDFEENIFEIRRVARHECQHVGQTALKTVKDLETTPGIPDQSIRDKSYTPSGGGKRRRKDHALRDVEFQTRLSDELDVFERQISSIPLDYRRDVLRVWVGDASDEQKERVEEIQDELSSRVYTKEFFRKMKQREPEKWQDAIAKFVSEVDERGIDL